MNRSSVSRISAVLVVVFMVSWWSCRDTIDNPRLHDLEHIPWKPIAYMPPVPQGYPVLEQPSDNIMTIDGIRLGRKLFFDPILSIDSTISCSSCHHPDKAFTDGRSGSIGVAGVTARSSMSLLDIGFHFQGLFWDGRSDILEHQALLPIEDPVEMGESWDRVEEKLKNHPDYPTDFRKAFGISGTAEITRELAGKAIAQFQRILISGGQSKYDKFVRGEIFLEENEQNGFWMFFDMVDFLPDAECGHCHNAPLFTTTEFHNNGIQYAPDSISYPDPGLGAITGRISDYGKFKVPTLRNISYTGPYMHDGRFKTLDEVIDHYNSGGQYSPGKNAFIYPLRLTEDQKADLKAFLLTLNDTSFLSNPEFQSPF